MTKTQQIFELYDQLTDVEREIVKEKIAIEDDNYVETEEEMAELKRISNAVKSGEMKTIVVDDLHSYLSAKFQC